MTSKRIAVYTAIFNDYDLLLEPKCVPENVDFICFTDNKDTATGVWQPYIIEEYGTSPKLMSGKIKTRPDEFLPEYDHSVWIDGNIQITSDIKRIFHDHMEGTNLVVPSHPKRNCIFEEGEACIETKNVNSKSVRQQMERYRKKGFPEQYGLSETRVMFRNHNEPDVVDCMKTWWSEYKKGAERDQLSFEFAVWKTKLNYKQIHIDYESSSDFSLHPHRLPGSRFSRIYDILLKTYIHSSGRIKEIIRLLMSSIRIFDKEGAKKLLLKMVEKLNKHRD